MTNQMADRVIYEGQSHRPISIAGKGLPQPHNFGLDPFPISSACWRGFYCEYRIRKDQLWLTHLVSRHTGDQYPIIDGTTALYEEAQLLGENEDEPEELVGRWVQTVWIDDGDTEVSGWGVVYDGGIYTGLNILAPLTGGILLGVDDIDIPYIQFDLNYLLGSKTVLELLFDKGILVKTIDHSVAVTAKREEVLGLQRPAFQTADYEAFEAEVKTWIRSTLNLNYKFLTAGWLNEIYS